MPIRALTEEERLARYEQRRIRARARMAARRINRTPEQAATHRDANEQIMRITRQQAQHERKLAINA